MMQIFNKILCNTHWIGFDSKWNLSVKYYDENQYLWNVIKKNNNWKKEVYADIKVMCAYFITWGLAVFLVNELQYR